MAHISQSYSNESGTIRETDERRIVIRRDLFHEGTVGYILSDDERSGDIFRELYILKITEVTGCMWMNVFSRMVSDRIPVQQKEREVWEDL